MKKDLISLPTAIFITFLVLKLTNTIDWSWWWVTAPLWIPAGLAFGVLIFILLLALIAAVLGADND